MRSVWRNERGAVARWMSSCVGLGLLGVVLAMTLLAGGAGAASYYPPSAGPVTKTDQGFQLTGTVYDYGGTTTYHFEYGTSTSYGTSVPMPDATAGSTLASNVAQPLGTLTPNSTYHYRLVSNNSSEGVAMSADRTFTTDAYGQPILAGPTEGGSGTAPPTPPKASESTAAGERSPKRVAKVVVSEHRRILSSLAGRTLYSLSVETHGKFICTMASGCTAIWHPLTIPAGASPKGPVQLGTVQRPEGTLQVTYRGRPLYTFGGDKKKGQRGGEGIKDVGRWHAVFLPSSY